MVVSLVPLTDGSFALPSNAIPGIATRPARVGEFVTLFGIGFGAVASSPGVGFIVTQASGLKATLAVSIGGTPATVQFAGLAPGSIGLYQFNFQIPSTGPSDAAALAVTLDGVKIQPTLYMAIAQ